MTDPRQIIDYAADGDAVGVRETMYSALYDRVTAAIEAKKQEVGATLVGGMPLATEETQLDDDVSDILDEAEKCDSEEDHEDAAQDKKMMTGVATKVAKKEVKGHETRMHKEDEDLEEGIVKKVGDTLEKGADALGDAGNAIGSLAGKALGGISKTVGVIRQTPAAVGMAYNKGRVGAQKSIAGK